MAAHLRLGLPPIAVGVRILRLVLNAPVKVRYGDVVVFQLKLGIPSYGVSKRKARVELNGPVIIRYGAVVIAQPPLGNPPVVVSVRVTRLERNAPVKVRYGTLVIAQFGLGKPPVVVGIRIIRIELNGLVIVHYGTAIVALNELGFPRLNERVIRRASTRADSERNGKDSAKGYRYEFLEHQVIFPCPHFNQALNQRSLSAGSSSMARLRSTAAPSWSPRLDLTLPRL